MLPALHIIEPPPPSSPHLPSHGSASSQGNRPWPASLLTSHPLPPQRHRGRGAPCRASFLLIPLHPSRGQRPLRGQNLILSPPSCPSCRNYHLNKKPRRASPCDTPAGYTGFCKNRSAPYRGYLSTLP